MFLLILSFFHYFVLLDALLVLFLFFLVLPMTVLNLIERTLELASLLFDTCLVLVKCFGLFLDLTFSHLPQLKRRSRISELHLVHKLLFLNLFLQLGMATVALNPLQIRLDGL